MLSARDVQAISALMDESLDKRLKIEFRPIHAKLDSLESGQKRLEDGQKKLEDRVQRLEKDVSKINMTLENDIVPRLDTIENCYTSTYHRYQDSVNDYEGMKLDIEILKEVTGKHSQILAELTSN